MLFKDIKQNYPIYILDKQNVRVIQGKVLSTTFPHADMDKSKLGIAQMPLGTPYLPNQSPMVVDVTIEAEGKTATYSIPENVAIAYAGMLVLATEREGIAKELEALKVNAEQVIASVNYQQQVVDKATALLAELDPHYKEQAATEARFSKMESDMSELKTMFANFITKQEGRIV